jgi:CRISPR-associated RAMP protein (TIGR02581 family)
MSERIRYVITGKIRTKTSLHIGSGSGNARTDATVVKDLQNRPFVPGSSLKGALRSAVEQLVGPIAGIRTCQLTDVSSDRCISTDEEWQQAYKEKRSTGASEARLLDFLDGKVCDTCHLFGSTAMASRLAVSDLPIVERGEERNEETELRHGVGIDRDTETARESVKFDFETVPSEKDFWLEMVVESPSPTDLGLLAAGLREMELGMIPLGGNSSRGVGRCRLHIDRIIKVDMGSRAGLRAYLLESEPGADGQPARIAGEALDVRRFIRDSIDGLFDGELGE